MTDIGAERVGDLFERALEIAPERREAYLDSECGDDARLRERIEQLLRLDEDIPDAFLRGGRPSGASHIELGALVGGYEILGTLGEGGMGTVYEAQQASPHRRVALKVIRTRYVSSTALRRFRQEAEVLGSLHHPGIAQVYEAGTAEVEGADGIRLEVPFLAMELVRGSPLLEYARSRKSSLRARLELVTRLCDAVQHAHQRGIIHRDLKSENVLVSEPNSSSDPADPEGGARDVAQPKILDFGVARVVGSERRTLETQFGQILGTLGTMSPEQVSGDSAQVDVRTDVFALGVVLYELLAGRPPLDLTGSTIPEAARRIVEEDPPLLRDLIPSLRGDVSIITAKALHKDKERRYQSAADLGDDIRKHLSGAAIEARADSTLYVLGKGLRRHRALSSVVAIVVLLTSTFAAVFSLQARRLEQELVISNIERGRLFGLDRNGLGEELIWREFLEDPESPHAYWALWEFYSNNPCVVARHVSEVAINTAEVSPDGTWLALGDIEGEVGLWDAMGTRKIATLRGPKAHVRTLTGAPDGRSLAAAYGDGSLRVWDVPSESPRWGLDAGLNVLGRSSSLDYHPEGRLLAGAVGDTVQVWDASSGELVRSLEHEEEAKAVAFSPTGELLVALGGTWVRLWRFPDPEPLETWKHGGARSAIPAFGAQGKRLYIGGADKTLTAWDLEPVRLFRRLHPGNGWYSKLWTSEDGAYLFASGLYRVDRWRLPDLTPDGSVPFFSPNTPAVVPLSGGELVVAADTTGVMRVWEWGEKAGVLRFPAHERPTSADLSPDGRRLATGDSTGVVRVHDVATGELLVAFDDNAGRVRSLRFHPRRSLLGAASEEGTFHLWNVDSGTRLQAVHGIRDISTRAFDFSPDGEWIASAYDDATFHLWPVDGGGEPIVLVSGYEESLSVAFSPDGQTLATVSRALLEKRWAYRIDLWTLGGERVGTLERPDLSQWTLAFSGDGSKLAASTWERKIAIWDLESRRLEDLLEGHEATIWSLCFRPGDPDTLISSSADGTVRLWSLSLGRNVCTLRAFPQSSVNAVDISADGTLLSAAGEGEEVLIWDLTHFERHVAGHLGVQLERHDIAADAGLLRWADEVLARPWPRFAATGRRTLSKTE